MELWCLLSVAAAWSVFRVSMLFSSANCEIDGGDDGHKVKANPIATASDGISSLSVFVQDGSILFKTDTSVFKRLGRGNQENIERNHQEKNLVCKYWLEGRCTRNPCRFKHPDQGIKKSKYAWENPNTFKSENSPPIEKPQTKILKNKENSNQNQIVLKIQKNLLTNKVNQGQTKSISKINSKKLHPGFYGNGLSMLTRLEGYTKCGVVVDFDDECGTLVNEGPWIFVGLRIGTSTHNMKLLFEEVADKSMQLLCLKTFFLPEWR
ncbi:hypothetical protein L1887_35072 [Cichorium endivia]|nr:hypothetical protein L1887_35072 [Cichorium endivia]